MNVLTEVATTTGTEQTFVQKLNENTGVILFAIAIAVGVAVIAWIARKYLKGRR